MEREPRWWQTGAVYQVYPRSFADASGDGIGDLRGILDRLDHLAGTDASLGVDAVWLSPISPSPQHDFGYDISDYTDVAPEYGTLADADALIAACHERGIRFLMDLVPCHTSIEHPWFREHPDWYIWADPPPGGRPRAAGRRLGLQRARHRLRQRGALLPRRQLAARGQGSLVGSIVTHASPRRIRSAAGSSIWSRRTALRGR